jgi:hypothetical protein
VKKENICAPALAFVFAWHRIGAIGAYEKRVIAATRYGQEIRCAAAAPSR